ncbi:MAG TPA: hypothetical protein VHO06_15520 [Polyangia bacterium]|nr:hypothetical protein [Polyangia bacterium]
MSRPDPIQYAERLYAAIRAANFSPISFLTFGNAVKDGVDLRRMPRIAAEPFMRVVGEMLELEEEVAKQDIVDAEIASPSRAEPPAPPVIESATSTGSEGSGI